jgi:hypothetical protein
VIDLAISCHEIHIALPSRTLYVHSRACPNKKAKWMPDRASTLPLNFGKVVEKVCEAGSDLFHYATCAQNFGFKFNSNIL